LRLKVITPNPIKIKNEPSKVDITDLENLEE